jgi:protocatechuate 3,4-dioxygenase beta subunit
MKHDHEGQRVSRRTLVRGLSLLSLGGVLTACTKETTDTPAAPGTAPASGNSSDIFAGLAACALTPETTQGPYYFDADKVRSDIREDRAGKRLRVAIKVQDSETCTPAPNAVVEIWHCDAGGLYSGAESASLPREPVASGK